MRWTRDETLLALHLYERISFGQQHHGNPEVIALATRLGRTPGSIAMKLNNFTSLDPDERARGVVGLEGASELDRQLWVAFHSDPTVVEQAEELWAGDPGAQDDGPIDFAPYAGPTEGVAARKVRIAQRYFRRAVLANFGQRCALTDVGTPELLTASHIVGWAEDAAERMNAANGLCLNRLHDAAFDRHLVTFDDQLRLVVSRRLRARLGSGSLALALLEYEGAPLRVPLRRRISPALLERHRAKFFASEHG